MYISLNIEVRSCNHCGSGKAISITYSESVAIVLGIQHAMRLRHIVICGLPGFTIFYYITSYTLRFSKKVVEHKICVYTFSTNFV